jgi:pSer/pThr/pTyr-binding forkhead associated (FHA) protein
MGPFLEACGATSPLSLSIASPGTPAETRTFDLPFVRIGRDPRAELRLTDLEVSHRHAYLQLINGRLLCLDLGSRAGVYARGKRRRLGQLDRDQTIRIGPYRIRLLAGNDPEYKPDRDSAAPGRSAPALGLLHRSLHHSRYEPRAGASGLLLVGSGADCQVRLIDPSVASHHCSLVQTPRGVWVVDLLGPQGLRVNGREVSYAQLRPGDSVQLGPETLRFAPEQEREPESHAMISQAAERLERTLGRAEVMRQHMLDELEQARALLLTTFATLREEHSAFLNQELDQLRQLAGELHTLQANLKRQAGLLEERTEPFLAPSSVSLPLPSLPAPMRLGMARAGTSPTVVAIPAGNDDEDVHAQFCARIARIEQEHQTHWQKLLSLIPSSAPTRSAL